MGRWARAVLEAVFWRPRLVLGALVAALGVAAAAFWLVPPRYRASAHLWDSQAGGTSSSLAAQLAQRRFDAVRQRVLAPSALQGVGAPSSAVAVRSGERGDFFIDCVRADPAEAARIPNALARLLVVEAEGERAQAERELQAVEARLADAKKAMDEAAAAIVRLRARRQPAAQARPALERLAGAYGDARKAFLDLEEQRRVLRAALPGGPAVPVRFTVLEAAFPPKAPSFPRPTPFILVGAALGLMAGVAAAVVAERRDRSVKCVEDLSDTLGSPILAEVPLVRVARRAQRGPSTDRTASTAVRSGRKKRS